MCYFCCRSRWQIKTSKRFVSGTPPGPTPFSFQIPTVVLLGFLCWVLSHSVQLNDPFLSFHVSPSIPRSYFPKYHCLEASHPCPNLHFLLTLRCLVSLSVHIRSTQAQAPLFPSSSLHRSVSVLLPSCPRGKGGLSNPTQASKFTPFFSFCKHLIISLYTTQKYITI